MSVRSEILEAAARAIYDELHPAGVWARESEMRRQLYRDAAEAALEVAAGMPG